MAAVWKNDTIHRSNIDEKHAHPAYQAIIAMGPDILPLIFAELQRRTRRLVCRAACNNRRESGQRESACGLSKKQSPPG